MMRDHSLQLSLACVAAIVIVNGCGSGSTAMAGATFAIRPTVASVKSSSPIEFEITSEWLIDVTPSADRKVYVHFTDSKGEIKFKDEFDPDPVSSKWAKGKLKLKSRTVKIPEKLAGPFEIRMGTMDQNGIRDAVFGASDGELRIRVGQIKVEGGKVVFEDLGPK